MASFACATRDSSGNSVQRIVDASSPHEAIGLLENDGLFAIEITELSSDAAATNTPVEQSRATGSHLVDRRISRKELLNFSLQLGSSVRAGVPILFALESIARQTPKEGFRLVLEQMRANLEGGQSLSEAMRAQPKAFPEVYSSTVAAAEISGSLEEVLDNLADYVEAEMEVRADVRSALLYPAMVISTLGLAVTVLILFVIPRFAKFYSGFDAELPLPTRILVTTSQLATDYFVIVLVSLAAIVYGIVRARRTRAGRRAIDQALLHVPVIRRVIQTANTLHVTQMIGLFTQAGVPILEGLRTIAKTTTSMQTGDTLLAVAEDIAAGETLAESMEARDCFPPTARQMLAAGESTGTLEPACAAVSRLFKKELRYLTKNLATLIEPLLTLVLATIVLFVALAVFLPMWDLVKVIGK